MRSTICFALWQERTCGHHIPTLCCVKLVGFHRHLSIAETLYNIYSKADKVSKKDEQDFAEFAFLGIGMLVRTQLFISLEQSSLSPF